MSPRYLFGPLTAAPLLPERPADVSWITFGASGGDVVVQASDSWETIRRRLPGDERLDGIVIALHETAMGPVGLWSAPLPLVVVVLDAPTRWHLDRLLLARSDLVVCTTDVAERLRRVGIEHVHVPELWDDPPLHVQAENVASSRNVDLLALGDLHPARQRDWLPRLRRLSSLGRRWRVRIESAAGQDEELLLRSARFFFAHGQTVADDRRLERAAAWGAVPLLPTHHGWGPHWQHDRNCLRYESENLETLLQANLEDEEKRQRLAVGAQQTICGDRARFWPALLAVLQRDQSLLAGRAGQRVPWDRPEERRTRMEQAIHVGTNDPLLDADRMAAKDELIPEATFAHGLLAARRGDPAAAAMHFRSVLDTQPANFLAALYLAEMLVRGGQTEEAVEQARRALVLLDAQEGFDSSLVDALPLPPGRDVFALEWQRAAWEFAGDPRGEAQAKRTLLFWRLHGLLARWTGKLVYRYEATLARPDLPATRASLGAALVQAGHAAEAIPHLQQAVIGNPFDGAAARLLHDTLGTLCRRAQQNHWREERQLLHQAAPRSVPSEPWFQSPVRTSAFRPPRVSLCLIVKNEEANLARCLASCAELVQEIVVVDTGSSDATPEVARRWGARVHAFPWCDSFSAARNETLRHTTGDWVLSLDADDVLDEENRGKLRTLLADLPDELIAYLLRVESMPDTEGGAPQVVDQVKLFRRDPRLRWEYRVHEQILLGMLRLGGILRPTNVVIHHTGYHDPALRRRKLERNRRLLLLEQSEQPDDPLTLFNLGALHLDVGQAEEAVAFLRRALERSAANYSLRARLYALLTSGLRGLDRVTEALATCQQGRVAHPDDGQLLYLEAQLLSETGNIAAAEANLHRLLTMPMGSALSGLDTGIHGYKSRYLLAQLCLRQGRREEAERHAHRAMMAQPDFVPAWLAWVEARLALGRGDALTEEITRIEPPVSRLVQSMVRARLHLARKEFAAARVLLEDAASSWPRALWPRLMLGQALVREGRDPSTAIRVLREVLSLDPSQVEARRLLAGLLSKEGVVDGACDG